MKTIGVLGGIDPQATMDFEQRVHAVSKRLIPQGSTTLNRDQAASGRAGGWVAGTGDVGARLGGRPRRVGATQAGSGTR